MDSRTKSIQDILGLMQKNLECSICLDLLTNPVSTKCDHPFCRFCITEFLKTKTSVPCPLCKCPITKRSLNDRPQLSNIVENVRRLMGAFSKDTGQKCSPPRASSSANLLSCTPEQLPRKEAKGTKRKISVSEKKGTAGKSNVRQSKRRKSDLTPEVMESTQDNTETDIINETADGLETDQHVINTALNHRINKEKENQEESKSGLILSCLKSDAGGTLSEKGDPSCTNPKALTKGNTKPGNINLKGRTKSISHLSGPEKDEEMGVSGKANPKELTKEKKELGDTNLKSREKRTRSTSLVSGPEGEKMARTAGNLNSERHLRAQNKKNYKEDSDEIDFNDDDEQVQGHSESQGHSELSSLPESTPHVATVTRTYDKQFVSHRNVRSVSKVKDWLTSNDVHGKVPGDSQESDKVLHGGSLEQSSNSGDNGENFIEDEEEFELVSCDSSIPESIVDKEHADTSDKNPRHSETASTSLSLCSDNLPPTSKSQTEKGGQVAHKIFKTTRNDKHLETSVKQTKGKFLFKKIQPKSVLGIDQVMGVKPLKPKDRAVITQKESLKLRELDLNTFGNDSDPYEFKSSQVTPVKPKVHRRKAKARDDKRKEGQISVEVQNMLSRKSGKSILKKANGDDLKEGMSGRGGEGAEGKKKKLSPKALQRQKDEEEALKEMRDKISQAESYDLVTSTQEVIDHLTEEENGAEEEHDSVSKNKKIVSFNQDVIFISSQNQNGVKSLKGVGESPKNRKTQLNYIEKNFTEEAGVRTSKNGGGNQETEEVFRDDCETGAHHKEKVEVQDTSENFIDEISENVLSSKENKAGNLKVTSPEDEDNDDGNSSSTTDLDIHPGESEFAVPNLDIQPKEILEKLSSQDIIPNIAVNENNRTANCDTEMEVDIVPNSEDLGKDTGVPNYKRKSGIEAMAKNPTRKKVKEGCKRDDDNVNLNKGDRQQRYIIQELEDSSSLAVFGGEELEAEGNCQKVDVKGREADVNSVNVVPETPLIAIDSEASVTDASSQPQEKKLIRKSRLKKSNKEKTCKKSPVATKNEESQKKEKGTDLTNLPSTKDKEMSENIVPPSVDVFSTDLHSMDVVVLDQQSGKEGSGSISTHLSSETQDSQTSLGSKFKESERTSTQQSSETQNSQACTVRKLKNSKKKRGNRKAVPFVIQETPVLGEAKVRDEEVTETWKQKQNTDVVTDSQQSMSSLCSTQESVSILAPVHKSFEKVVDKKSPDFLKENLQAVNKNKGEDKDIIELKSRENEAEDLQGKSLSCEIIPEEEDSPIVIAESKQSTRSTYNKLRRPKRKCFSLGSPEEAPKRESQARNKLSKVDDEEMEKQGSRKKEEVQTGKCEEDLEIVEDLEKKQRIPEINPSEVNSSGDVKSTPSDALIPTQLSLRSIKKQEMKLKKQQQQSSPEDVFLMDSEPLGSGSGYQDLVQNQEGLLELELGDLDGVNEMETRESQVRSSSGRASGEVEDSMDGDSEHVEKSSNVKDYRKDKVEHIQCSGSGNDRPNEDNEGKNSETVTTVPDTEENEEVLVPKRRSSLRSARSVPSDSHVSQIDVKMRDKRDSLKNSDSQKNSSSSGSYASNAGRRAVRGLARKLRQKNLHDPHIISDECKVKMSDKDICNGDPSNSSEEVTSTSKRKDEKFEHQPMEEPVCFSVVPETMEVGLEDLEDQMDDEVTAIPETVEDSLPCEEEERDGEKSKTEEDEEEDTDLTDEKTTGIGELNDGINEKTTRIQEELKPDDSEKRKEKGLERSLVSVKEDSLRMDDIQEGEDNKVKMDDVVSSPAQSSRQEDGNGGTVGESETLTRKASYMETAADDEPLFHSPESSPLPDILEEEYEQQKERPSGCVIKSLKEAVPQKEEDSEDSYSSGFELLSEDIIKPEDMGPEDSPQKASVDFVEVWEGKIPSYERDAKSKRMGSHAKKRSEEDEIMKNFVELSDDDDSENDDVLIHRWRKAKKKVVISDDDDSDVELTQRQTKKVVLSDDDDDSADELTQRQTKKKVLISDDDDDDDNENSLEEKESFGRKKKKKAVIISDDEEGNDVTDDKKSKTSIISNDEDDSDSSQESLVSRQMNLTSSSAFSSQSEGYNTQNQILLQQELERMKKEMAEIESRISKGNQSKNLKEQKSPSPSPSQEEPYSEYLRELQTEESEGDSVQQSQNTVSKMADDIEGCDSDDSSDLFLSPAPPSPPPNDPRPLSTAGVDLTENFKETEEFLKELRSEEKTSEGKFITEENCEERLSEEGEAKGRSENEAGDIIRSNQKSKNSGINSKRDNLTDIKEPSVIQESPQSQKPGKTSMARLKDLYHSTPVSNIKKPQGGRKNTLSFLSPVLTPRELLGTPQTEVYTAPSVNVPSPAVQRSPKEDHQSKVFIASGLPLSQLNELRRLVQSHDCKFHPKFSPYTTHLIVKTVPPGSRMCERTLKFFQALAYKCWILDYQWVTDSVAKGRLLEEGPYEICGDTVTNEHHYGPRKSRTQSPTDPGILNGIQFHIIGSSQGLSSDDIRDLIETCGGCVIQEPEEFDLDGLCIIITCAALEDSQETAPSQEVILFNRLYRRYGAVTVSREWLLDSLTVYNLQPLSEYVLTSVNGMVIPSV